MQHQPCLVDARRLRYLLAKRYAPLGVKGFVLGTTLLFGKNKPYVETMKKIRSL